MGIHDTLPHTPHDLPHPVLHNKCGQSSLAILLAGSAGTPLAMCPVPPASSPPSPAQSLRATSLPPSLLLGSLGLW